MARISIVQTIEVYEVGNDEVPIGATETMEVLSHWNRVNFVILKFGGKSITIDGGDLITAARNAMNTGGI